MSLQVNIHDAKTHLSSFIARLNEVGEIIISRAGEPVARLLPIKKKSGKRILGSAKGKIKISPDFDDPLPESILKLFYQ